MILKNLISRLQFPVFDLNRANNPFIRVIPAIADPSAKRIFQLSLWPDDRVYDFIENSVDSDVLLGTAAEDIIRRQL